MATKPGTEKKTRTIDPAIAELRAQHKHNVENLNISRVSAATLKRITDDLLPKLTAEDHAKLREALVPFAIVN